MNVQLVREVAGLIGKYGGELYEQATYGDGSLEPDGSCGSPCCVAGWVYSLRKPKYVNHPQIGEVAADELLGEEGSEEQRDAVNALFDCEWPLIWFERVGISVDVYRVFTCSDGKNLVAPNHIEASKILTAMANDGKFWRHPSLDLGATFGGR